MGQDSQVKHFDHVGGSHAPLDAESQVLTGELIDNVTDLEHAPLPIRIKLEINGPHLPRSASLDRALQARRSAGLVGFARAQAAPRPSPASRQSAQACASRTSSWSSILPGHKQPGLLRTTLSKQTVRKTQTLPAVLALLFTAGPFRWRRGLPAHAATCRVYGRKKGPGPPPVRPRRPPPRHAHIAAHHEPRALQPPYSPEELHRHTRQSQICTKTTEFNEGTYVGH